jgi:RimJ/RimL family protein N-acetyltransferase
VVIETERLILRPLAVADLDEYLALHDDPEVTRFIHGVERPEAEQRLRDNELEWDERGYGRFAVLVRPSGRFLGRSGLKYWPQFDETEVGWTLRRAAWGRGLATEAARACVDWGFEAFGLPYLTAMVHPQNAASIRVAEHLGMSLLRDDILLEDAVRVFALYRNAE